MNAQSDRKQLSYLVGVFAAGNVVSTTLQMLSGILIARMLAPSVLGLFSGIGLVLGYAPIFQMGIPNGLNRELPYYIGKGERVKAEELAASSQAWMILLGSLSAIALIIVSIIQMTKGNLWQAAGWCTHALLVFFLFYSTNYLQITYRTAHDFARLSIINVIQALVGIVLLVLVWAFDFYGLCLRAVLTAIIAAGFFYYWRPIKIGPQWNYQNLKHLFVIGAPIFIVGQVYAIWAVLNQTLVFSYTGTHGMGLYTMVTMASAAMMIIPQSLSQVIYPRMAELFGRGASIFDLCKLTFKPMLLSAICMAPLSVLAWWMVEPVTRLIVPQYIDAVPAIKWALIQPVIACFSPINNIFNVIRKQKLYLYAILCGIIFYGVSLMLLISANTSLIVFPQAMLIGYTIFIVVSYITLLIVSKRPPLCQYK